MCFGDIDMHASNNIIVQLLIKMCFALLADLHFILRLAIDYLF